MVCKTGHQWDQKKNRKVRSTNCPKRPQDINLMHFSLPPTKHFTRSGDRGSPLNLLHLPSLGFIIQVAKALKNRELVYTGYILPGPNCSFIGGCYKNANAI